MASIIGADLGGTKIATARYDVDSWAVQEEERQDTHAECAFNHVLNDAIILIEKLRSSDTIGVGIGVPGLVRWPQGEIVRLPNIPGAEGVELKTLLSEKIGLPIEVDNDVNCFVLAEAMQGAGKENDVVVGIAMGTGVGGGIVIDGKIVHGHHGFAGEIGHMLLKPGEPPYDTEDKRGDAEQFLSGTAMGKRCSAANRPEEYLEGKVCVFMQSDVVREVVWMCVNVIHLLDPAVIVFGGSAGRALKPHLPAIERELLSWLLPGTPLPKLSIAELSDAGTRGAALLLS